MVIEKKDILIDYSNVGLISVIPIQEEIWLCFSSSSDTDDKEFWWSHKVVGIGKYLSNENIQPKSFDKLRERMIIFSYCYFDFDYKTIECLYDNAHSFVGIVSGRKPTQEDIISFKGFHGSYNCDLNYTGGEFNK